LKITFGTDMFTLTLVYVEYETNFPVGIIEIVL